MHEYSIFGKFSYLFLTGNNFWSVYIKSVGCDDKGKKEGSCDYAHAYIEVNGKEYAKQTRGHNIVVIDYETGIISNDDIPFKLCSVEKAGLLV